jgi:hypothetical protein
MRHQRIIANVTAVLVLLPTTFFALLGSWIFFSLFYAALRGAPYVQSSNAAIGALAAALGCLGLVTLWTLYFRLCRTSVPFRARQIHWLGLIAGITSSLLLLFWIMVETPWPNRLVYAWPLLAAVVFGVMISRRPNAA